MEEIRPIDANALKKAIGNVYGLSFEEMKEMFPWLEIIDSAPTIPLPDFKDGYKQAIIDGKTNFSRPHGEWNYFAEEMGGIRMTGECPNCKQRRILDNFCSNCGADMRKEE